MRKAIVIALSGLFVLPAAMATETVPQTFTVTHSENRNISEVRLNARHTGQEIQYDVAMDILYNAQDALAALPNDPAMQLVMEKQQQEQLEVTMK